MRAEWSTAEARWTVRGQPQRHAGDACDLSCSFLFMCSGYYRYDEGYHAATSQGSERFGGRDRASAALERGLDYAGKRVVVIGSGATAVTLVPAMAESAAHVTMLQRSPSYVVSLPAEDPIAQALRRFLPARLAIRSCAGRTCC